MSDEKITKINTELYQLKEIQLADYKTIVQLSERVMKNTKWRKFTQACLAVNFIIWVVVLFFWLFS